MTPKYQHGLVEMLVNKIHIYEGKMTVLCNTQDGHFDVDLKDVSSLKGQLANVSNCDTNEPLLGARGSFCSKEVHRKRRCL